MNITLANQTKNFTPNFKGNLVPDFAMSTEDTVMLENHFDSASPKGDSFEFAKTFAKELGTEDTFNPNIPQKIHLDDKCIFDSTKSNFGMYADADGKNAILSIATSSDSMNEWLLDTKSNKFPETIKVVRGFLENIIMNLDTKIYSGYAEKDIVFATCVNLLKKLRV